MSGYEYKIDESLDESKGNQNYGANSSGQNYKNRSKSIWSWDEQGNVKVGEICYNSILNKCSYEAEGCSRLHSDLHFHWQISKHDSEWINLPKPLVIELEVAYCDPNNDGIDLSKVEIKKLSEISDILGTPSWKLNFDTFLLKSEKKSIHSRRLCTEKIVGKKLPSNKYIWYFLDAKKRWIEYGKYDSQTHFGSETNSEHIEFEFKKYLCNNRKNTMLFQYQMMTYRIDFDSMDQTNLKSQVKRKARRRPELDVKYKY
ncbi:unnamed protein product [Meganyctiphanes norvegica]|uniref:WWE domain-containing protein n=1 Tax=Meganyctiphanes norvegica TaxID=48144 RepID=A0AAV2QEB2_MEGNR